MRCVTRRVKFLLRIAITSPRGQCTHVHCFCHAINYGYWYIYQTKLRSKSLLPTSLMTGRSGYNFINTILSFVLVISIFRSYDNDLRWTPQDLTDKSLLVYRYWLGAVRQQAFTWTIDDQVLWCHMHDMVSLFHSECCDVIAENRLDIQGLLNHLNFYRV